VRFSPDDWRVVDKHIYEDPGDVAARRYVSVVLGWFRR
jgi:hypothetical protein